MRSEESFDNPHPVDVYVGHRVRERRVLQGMSQKKLGQALGIAFQQVQKNEKGTNRIGSSRLFQLSQALDVPISYFFEGYSKKSGSGANAGLGTQSLRLARRFDELTKGQRNAVYDLVRSLADSVASELPRSNQNRPPKKKEHRGRQPD